MDNYYVGPDGQIMQLPKRSFLDRLTSGLYDASVEWRKPGGAQESRLNRTQPLTSALNQYGAQQRTFGQEDAMLDRRQGFESDQARLEREAREKLQNDELDARRALQEQKLAQDAAQFNATHGLAARAEDRLTLGQNMRGWDTARQTMIDMPRADAQVQADLARAKAEEAHARLLEAQITSALRDQGMVTPGMAQAVSLIRPELFKDPGAINTLTNLTQGQLMDLNIRPAGTSGTGMSPEVIQRLLGNPVPMPGGGGTNRVGKLKGPNQ
jgi:hypothetical protein